MGAAMVCLFHSDYGPPDPGFAVSGSTTGARGWTVDTSLLREARNIGEAEAIQRHVLRGETVTWCHQGYSWVDQQAIHWFYLATFAFVVLPYFLVRTKVLRRRFGLRDVANLPIKKSSRVGS
jgi:hypothetical protein